MMTRKIILFFAVLTIFSCNPRGSETQTATSADTVQVDSPSTGKSNSGPPDWSGCYLMGIEKDSAFMRLTKNAGGYEGTLEYRRFEKDSNKGTVSLLEDEKYLKGWYKFESESIISVREVYFRKTAKGLEEGYGEISMVGDTVLYKYPATLSYENKHPFIKSNCN